MFFKRFLLIVFIINCFNSIQLTNTLDYLSSDEFYEFKNSHPVFMIVFTVEWCTNCRKAIPEIKLAETVTMSLPTPVPIKLINGSKEDSLTSHYDVFNFPRAFLINYDEELNYTGRFLANDLINFVKKEITSPLQFISEPNDVDFYRNKDEAVLIGLYDSLTHHTFGKFRKIASKMTGYLKSMISTNPLVRAHYGAMNKNFTMLILKATRFETDENLNIVDISDLFLNHSLTNEQIIEQIIYKQLPIFGIYNEFTQLSYNKIEHGKLCMISISFGLHQKTYSLINDLVNNLRTLTDKYFKDQIYWVLVDDTDHADYVNKFSDTDDFDQEIVAACKINNKKYQLYGSKLNLDELKMFITTTLIKSQVSAQNSMT